MNKDQLLSDMEASTAALIKMLSRFTKENANVQPSPGEWSAAQVGDHLLILEAIANKVMRGETKKSTRPPDTKLSMIREAMADIVTKRVAPLSVLPSEEKKDITTIIKGLEQQRNLLNDALQSYDLSEACMSFKHPSLGTLTRLEWIAFTIYHAERHVLQMQQLSLKVFNDRTE